MTTVWPWCRTRSSMLTAVVCSGRNRSPGFERPSATRSRASDVRRRLRRTGTAAVRRRRPGGAKPSSSTRGRSLRRRFSMAFPTELLASPR